MSYKKYHTYYDIILNFKEIPTNIQSKGEHFLQKKRFTAIVSLHKIWPPYPVRLDSPPLVNAKYI